jgi:hypothetical protein
VQRRLVTSFIVAIKNTIHQEKSFTQSLSVCRPQHVRQRVPQCRHDFDNTFFFLTKRHIYFIHFAVQILSVSSHLNLNQ